MLCHARLSVLCLVFFFSSWEMCVDHQKWNGRRWAELIWSLRTRITHTRSSTEYDDSEINSPCWLARFPGLVDIVLVVFLLFFCHSFSYFFFFFFSQKVETLFTLRTTQVYVIEFHANFQWFFTALDIIPITCTLVSSLHMLVARINRCIHLNSMNFADSEKSK